ncbi:KAP family P-loop NTPase fold protein [Thermophilibacter mediterraneus]|uniref:KAP family P-loop NTPase fold protein n=1 Tax=Thermophilibacter mediterraneus TaxID=1871031 RepID=UPI0009313C2F|nr:P-loop NTPase fold protein [Thermophilibacter mediterraneus]
MNSDHPIESCPDDALGRASVARRVADQLALAPMDHSIVFGLYGPWGSGKTSLLNMVCEKLEGVDNPPVIVKFNPWNYTSSENLATPFLALLSECIQHGAHSTIPEKAARKLSKTMKRYSDVLASAADAFNWVPAVGVVSTLLRHIGRDDEKSASPTNLKNRLSKLLIDTNTRVVVIIDDLDRLSNDAVRSVFQLVAAVADFPGVNYLLAYDLNNVIKALGSVQECEGERYLEKIVQIPIELHEPNPGSILELLVDGLNQLLSNHRLSDDEVNDVESCLHLVFRRIRSVRDLRRLLNVFEVDLAESCGGVAPADVLVMSSLRLFAPRLFPWISARRNELAGGARGGYELALAKEKRDEFSKELRSILNGDDEAELYVFDLLCKAFPRFENNCGVRAVGVSEAMLRLNRRIACPEILDGYLSGLLERYSFPREDALRLVKTGSADELGAFFAQEGGEVSSTVLSAAVELAPSLSSAQLENIVRAMLRSGGGNSKDPTLMGLFSVFWNSLEHLIRELGKESASRLMVEETRGRSFLELVPLAAFVNEQELSYARLAGDIEKPDEQLITLESLIEVERNIVSSLRGAEIKPADLEDGGSRMLLYLWSCFDSESYDRLVTNGVLREPLGYALHAMHYLGTFATGTNHGWSLSESRDDIDLPRLCSCMGDVAESEDFWKLPRGTRRLVAALSVCAEKAVDGASGVDWYRATASEREADMRLRSWAARLIS